MFEGGGPGRVTYGTDSEERRILEQTVLRWIPSSADFSDAALVAAASSAGQWAIASDDADLVTFDGITLYTANRHAIESAAAAGKLA